MKRQKQLTIALITVASALSVSHAAQAANNEPGRFGGARAAQWREWMQAGAKELNLTEEQKAKLKEIYAPQREKLREIRQDQNLTREQKLEKFRALRAEFEPKLKGILTQAQWEKWQQRKTQARERWKNARKEWNLTDEQRAKLKAIRQTQMDKARKLREDTSLSPQEKVEKFKALRAEVAPKVKEILTPEQYVKWEQARGQMLEKASDRWQQRKQQ